MVQNTSKWNNSRKISKLHEIIFFKSWIKKNKEEDSLYALVIFKKRLITS